MAEKEIKRNSCLACVKNCCRDFKVALQMRDPLTYQEMLREFPFVKITDKELILFNGREAVVNIHNCERLQDDGSCKDYDTLERPQFCHDAGVKGAPHPYCIVYYGYEREDENGV